MWWQARCASRRSWRPSRRWRPGRARAYRLDVTDAAAVERVVAQIAKDTGRIDVVVNNAGYGLVGMAEEVSEAEARRLLDTNFFGLLAVVRAALPQLRAQRSGHIVNISSTAGSVGIAGMALYSASKFAVEGLSEALAGEVGAAGYPRDDRRAGWVPHRLCGPLDRAQRARGG